MNQEPQPVLRMHMMNVNARVMTLQTMTSVRTDFYQTRKSICLIILTILSNFLKFSTMNPYSFRAYSFVFHISFGLIVANQAQCSVNKREKMMRSNQNCHPWHTAIFTDHLK